MNKLKGLTKDELRREIEREMRDHHIALPPGGQLDILALDADFGDSNWAAQLLRVSGVKFALPPSAEHAFDKIKARLRQRYYVKCWD